jgi:L-alanine-DL-glutamate epimerase-like enolase superfamily enzyme
MKLTLSLKHFKLELKYPFTISRSTRTHQDTVIVSISDGVNTGYGEAIPYPFYRITLEKLADSLQKATPLIVDAYNYTPETFWQLIEPELKDNYFALCGLDCAFWDYYAKSSNRTTRSYFTNEVQTPPMSNYTIGIDTLEVMKQKIFEQPWPVYKIKLGTEQDVEIIKQLRRVTDAVFRVDANCAWTVDETLQNAIELKELGVEFLEQPLHQDNWEGMKTLKKKCVLPIIADESCQRFDDVEQCAEAFHGINIKLMKCGGITPALKMIELARQKGIKVMAGCMAESSVGISNLCQISPLLDYIDADGAMLMKNDTAKGVVLEYGNIIFSNKNGSGIDKLLI